MSLAHRVGMIIAIGLVIQGGRLPSARAMTLPDIHNRQETSLAVSVVPTSAAPVSVETPISSIAVSTSSTPSAAPTTASAVTSTAASTTPSSTPSSTSPLVASSITPTTIPSEPSLSASLTSISASASASINSTSSTSLPSASSLAQELGSPLPKPNYAPGGMAFILPAFVVIGLIFIIWLIHKTKEYIWKLKEAEEAADTQSPNPGAAGGVLPSTKPRPSEKTGLGGKWKKKGWKELESESDDEGAYPRGRGDGDRYSRVGEWQGSRKYRSRERYARDRDDGHRDGERGRYGRVDAHDDDHYDRDVPARRPSRRDHRDHQDSAPEPGRRDDRDRDRDRDRPRSRNESGRHSPAPSHVSRALSKKEKKERAAEWINDERHHVSERRDSRGSAKGKERERGPEEYERTHATGQHFSLMPPAEGRVAVPVPQLEVQIGASAAAVVASQTQGAQVQRSKTTRKPAPEHVATPTRDPAPAPAPAPVRNPTPVPARDPTPAPAPSRPAEPPAHEDVPAYMRARAASPPPILSPPLHPNLFFHNGPSTIQLVPLSTYDSGTDLESMISAQPSPLPDNTADKLERSATTGPGRTVRKAQTPTNSRLVARTPTRTKSHDPAGTPTGAVGGSRADVLRTPTRRGTDGIKPTGRATPTIRLVESRGGSIRRAGEAQTPDLSKASGLTPKKYSKRVAPTSTPETIRRVRAHKKELKTRGKVDEILRDSWSERAVVSPVGGPEDDDEEEEVEVEVEEEREEVKKVPRDEVELAHSRAGAVSPRSKAEVVSPKPAVPPPMAPVGDARPISPTSPLKVKPKVVGAIHGVDSADIRSLQGIDQRMALMKQLEERMKRSG